MKKFFVTITFILINFQVISLVSAQSTIPNLKVAFIGDQGSGSNAQAVLQLIKNEGAHMVIHGGDFDYNDNPDAWDNQINNILGSNFPYFASIGNHDTSAWSGYQSKLQARLNRISGATCTGDLGVQSACRYQGLFFLLVGPGTKGSGHDVYIKNQLSADNSIWSVCSWHKNMKAMQVGGKGDDTGWGVYDECLRGGAIIATGHEHSYHRTKTLSNIQTQTVDASWPSPINLRVTQGSTFVFVSGLGGASIRNQDRCLPTTYPYGCNGEWASIYTSDQGAKYGALFITFNVGGNPNKATGYFKNTAGQTIDSFEITSFLGGGSTTTTTTITTTTTTTVPGTTTTTIPSAVKGDLNNDGKVDVIDLGILLSSWGRVDRPPADINQDGKVDIIDLGVLLSNWGKGTSTTTTTTTTLPPGSTTGIWISKEEIMKLPTSGTGWDNVMAAASQSVTNPTLQERDQDNTNTLAKAYVYARTGDTKYRQEVRTILEKTIGTHTGGDQLAVLRNMHAYVIAADLIDLKNYDPAFDNTYRNFLRQSLTQGAGGSCDSIAGCHEKRPNNWGTHAAASRIAIALYLNDANELARAASVHKGYLGDRNSYAGFQYGSLDWQCDSSKPVGINPVGCTKQGHSVDGVLPDDQRRGGGFTWPPFCENYVWEALQGVVVATQMLHRAGYPAWEWENRAVLRAYQWLHSSSIKSANWCAASGDDSGFPYVVNAYYKTNFPASPSTGKGMAFFEWTHGGI